MLYLKKNLDRGFKDISLFEIGPIFKGSQPGQQLTVIGAMKSGKISRLSWNEKDRLVDVFDAKKDLIQNNMTIGGCFHFQGLQNVLLPTEYNFDRKVIDFILLA